MATTHIATKSTQTTTPKPAPVMPKVSIIQEPSEAKQFAFLNTLHGLDSKVLKHVIKVARQELAKREDETKASLPPKGSVVVYQGAKKRLAGKRVLVEGANAKGTRIYVRVNDNIEDVKLSDVVQVG